MHVQSRSLNSGIYSPALRAAMASRGLQAIRDAIAAGLEHASPGVLTEARRLRDRLREEARKARHEDIGSMKKLRFLRRDRR